MGTHVQISQTRHPAQVCIHIGANNATAVLSVTMLQDNTSRSKSESTHAYPQKPHDVNCSLNQAIKIQYLNSNIEKRK